jgi:histidine triad (HIT) family protein
LSRLVRVLSHGSGGHTRTVTDNDQLGCPFCRIVRGEDPGAREVFRNEHVVAFLPLEPATPGHTLVVPRGHVPDLWSLDGDVAAHLARATLRLSEAVRRATDPEGLNIIQSNGKAATQTVFHLHVHIVPRWTGDRMGPIWPAAGRAPETDGVWQAVRRECLAVGER